VSPGALPRFLDRFETVYGRLGRTDTILAAAAAHHRLLWIHPFLDGNGRVARLMSYAMLLDTLDTGGVWSIARGLARNVTTYRAQLADCDRVRRSDLDKGVKSSFIQEFRYPISHVAADKDRVRRSLVARSKPWRRPAAGG
jgi:Fic family protein